MLKIWSNYLLLVLLFYQQHQKVAQLPFAWSMYIVSPNNISTKVGFQPPSGHDTAGFTRLRSGIE